jgi:hypothetical protein
MIMQPNTPQVSSGFRDLGTQRGPLASWYVHPSSGRRLDASLELIDSLPVIRLSLATFVLKRARWIPVPEEDEFLHMRQVRRGLPGCWREGDGTESRDRFHVPRAAPFISGPPPTRYWRRSVCLVSGPAQSGPAMPRSRASTPGK